MSTADKWRFFPRRIFMQFISLNFVGFVLMGLVSAINADDYRKNLSKRSLLCKFGLTGLIKEHIEESVADIKKNDTVQLGCAADCKLKDGILKGLSTLTLERELDVSCKDDNILLQSELGLKNPSISYKWNCQFVVGFSGSVSMRANKVQFSLAVTLNTDTQQALVKNMLLTKLEDFRFGFTGLGPLNPVIKGFVNLLYKVWSGLVTRTIERSVRNSIQKALSTASWSMP